ncbi:MAG TPA: hypothetical protein VLT33_26450, partial [Labilithrix sp.]|nr:hypothetical protein [Labilithrix sp.]
FEAADGDVIGAILREIEMLEEGVARLRAGSAPIDELMKVGRDAKWIGTSAFDAVNNLKKQSAGALAPHLPELAKALLPPGTLSMGCLDIIEAAGAAAFPSVAKEVYAHWGQGDDPYVLALLGNLKIAEPNALKIYEEGLNADDDDDTVEAALVAIGGLELEIAAQLAGKIEARVSDLEGDNLCAAIGLLGRLGSRRFEELVVDGISEMDDDTFATLVLALKGAPVGKLAKPLVERFAKMDHAQPLALAAIEGMVALGIGDKSTMRRIVETHFLARGPLWAARSNALLARWQQE